MLLLFGEQAKAYTQNLQTSVVQNVEHLLGYLPDQPFVCSGRERLAQDGPHLG